MEEFNSIETELETDTEETDTEAGSVLATVAVFGIGTIVGAAAARGYDKAKTTVKEQLEARRARKAAIANAIETTATEAK
jgi:nucleoside recognition membrane protein YjiH